MKKVFSLLLCTIMLFCTIINPVQASAITVDSSSIRTQMNDLDMYRYVQNTPSSELIAQGYSPQYINQVKSVDYEELMFERAQLPTHILYRMGYDDSEIATLRKYDGTYITRGSDMYALTGTLTAEIYCTSASTSQYIVRYSWEWDHSPLVNATDAMGIRWVAIASDGLPVDVSAYSSEASINYHYYLNTYTTTTYDPSDSNFASETDFNALTCTFSMQTGASTDPSYALSGSIRTTIRKDSGVTRQIYYLKICGVYGHSVINIGAPSVSFTPGQTDIGISFSGGINIDNIGIKKYKIFTNGTKEAIDA